VVAVVRSNRAAFPSNRTNALRILYSYKNCRRRICLLRALVGWDDSVISRMWSAILGCVALLFNPIVPIYLSRTAWHAFDIGVAIILTAHLVFVRLGWMRAKGS
jgi:hypothetical protein